MVNSKAFVLNELIDFERRGIVANRLTRPRGHDLDRENKYIESRFGWGLQFQATVFVIGGEFAGYSVGL